MAFLQQRDAGSNAFIIHLIEFRGELRSVVSLGINVQPKHATQYDREVSRILNYESVKKHKSALVGCTLLLMIDSFS